MGKRDAIDELINSINDYENDGFQEERETCPITDIELLRLSQCSVSTRMGMIDQGFPTTYLRLAALNLTEKVGNGYQVTAEGKVFLSKWHRKLQDIGAV